MSGMRERGASLLELIFIMVLLAGAIPPLLIAYTRIQERSLQMMPIAVASRLAADKAESLVKRKTFATIANEGPTAFESPYDLYRYQVVVNYVQENALDTAVDPTVTDFKRVEVRVTHSQIPGLDVRVITLMTNL